MKKLLTIILPALALTTGAPLAQECEYGYSFLAKAKKNVDLGAGRSDEAISLGHGLDEAEAVSAALTACKKAGAGAETCNVYREIATRGSPKARCLAVLKLTARGSGDVEQAFWGANEADAKKRAMDYCQDPAMVDPTFWTCHITEVMCTECLADKGYRYGAMARDNSGKSNNYGWATNFQSSEAATEGALSECARIGGAACEIVATFSTVPNATAGGWAWEQLAQDREDPNGSRCLAYVDDGDGNPAYPELKVGSSRQEAIDKSMQYCGGGGQCAVKLALCADDEADEVLAAD